eukprot:1136355-Pelagomonas_calceolata.AAC.6
MRLAELCRPKVTAGYRSLAVEGLELQFPAVILLSVTLPDLSSFSACHAPLSLNLAVGSHTKLNDTSDCFGFNHTSGSDNRCLWITSQCPRMRTPNLPRNVHKETTLPSVSAMKPSAKVNMAHSLLPWTLAVKKSSKNRALRSLKASLEILLTGLLPRALAPLNDIILHRTL